MNTRTVSKLLAGMLLLIVLQAGCATPTAQGSPIPPTESPSLPTASPLPTATATAVPAPPIPPSAPLVDQPRVAVVQMVDEQSGWGVLDVDPNSRLAAIGRTMDGSLTWYNVTPAGAEAFTQDDAFFFLDNRTAWLLLPKDDTTSSLYRTTDGGATWIAADAVPFIDARFSFINDTLGWALTHPIAGDYDTVTIFKTTDSGQNWQAVYSGDPANPMGGVLPSAPRIPNDVVFVDAQTGWMAAAGLDSIGLYMTEDGGVNWVQQDLALPQFQAAYPKAHLLPQKPSQLEPTHTSAVKPVFFNRYDGVLPVYVSHEGKAYIVFYVTHNGGQTWTPSQPISYQSGTTISIASVDDFFAWDGSEQLMATHDGGQTWGKVDTFLTDPINRQTGEPDPNENRFEGAPPLVAGMQFINGTVGWSTICNQQGQNMTVYKTTDGGQNWVQVCP